eukprot:GEMP01005575.1.p1 GENE.GEMP01005575.1~~GEMP01005575.1.p1  ORF type:complete len:951 (+),score=206.83 GEMP01005575.1:34-2886(+)
MEALLAAVAAPVTALFSYNRGNFMYDRGQDLTKKYQSYSFQVNQFGLYREDVRDLVALTIDKTNNYQVVIALELGFIIALIGPARLPEGTPSWITWLTFASLCEGVVFLTLAMWFAAHASISASSYGARLLTQHVRLPVPSDEQLSGAITRADDFEMGNMKKMLRMPFLKATFKKLWDRDGGSKEEITKDIITAGEHEQVLIPLLTHIRLYRKLQQFWINFDAYSRIALGVGTYSMLKALCFYSLGYYVHTMRNFYAGFVGVVLFSALATLLMMLDMMLTNKEIALASVLFSVPTFIASVGMGFQYGIDPKRTDNKQLYDFLRLMLVDILVPVVHFSAAAFNLWVLKKACPEVSDEDTVMPIHFRVVHFLDVFKNLRHNHTDRAISALNREADRNDLDPALAKVQAEGALSGALDEWKGKKNTSRTMALLEIALDLADAAGLGEDNALVRRAKLHVEELKVIQELQKERRLLQILQSPGIVDAIPETTRKEIEALYHRLPGLGGLATEVNDPGALNFDDTWLHVREKSTHASYYVSLGEQHKREPHVSKGSLIIRLETIKADIDNLKKRLRDIESLHHNLQEPSLHDPSTRRHHRKHTWYRDEHDAANAPARDSNVLRVPEVQGPSSSDNRTQAGGAPRENVYSVSYIMRELGSAFAPKNFTMDIDDQRLVAAFFPWKMFRAATFCVVAVWVFMGILRGVSIWQPAKEVIFFAEFIPPSPTPPPINSSRRLLSAHWDSFVDVPRINQPLFDPLTVACADDASIVLGNSYMAYSARDGARRCWQEHSDIGHVDGNLMALSADGYRLIPCDASEDGDASQDTLPVYSVEIPVRQIAVMGAFAAGIRQHRDGVILFERLDSSFRPIASLSKEPAIAVSITQDQVFALLGSTIVAWRLSDIDMISEHVITLDVVGKQYIGFCVTDSSMVFLEREETDDGAWSKTQVRQIPRIVD